MCENDRFGDWFLGVAETKFGLQEDFFKKIKQQNQSLLIQSLLLDFIKDLLGLSIEQIPNKKVSSFPTIEVNSNRQALKTCLDK